MTTKENILLFKSLPPLVELIMPAKSNILMNLPEWVATMINQLHHFFQETF
jgi:hypothetical protein